MDIFKDFSRRAFIKIFLFQVLLGALVFLTLLYGVDFAALKFSELKLTADGQAALVKMAELLAHAKSNTILYGLPAITFIFLFTALAMWIGLRRSLKKLLTASPVKTSRSPELSKKTEPAEDKAQKHRHDKQMFLYLLSLLQREGRLIDFLAEDLTMYEDAQIGAAVRGIHENCKKVIEKNLSPKPVLDTPEGETVTVEAGFNPGAIKLIGNVSGEPPFKGILRHRGWQSKKEELPTLSGTQDTGILAPAEVEIQ